MFSLEFLEPSSSSQAYKTSTLPTEFSPSLAMPFLLWRDWLNIQNIQKVSPKYDLINLFFSSPSMFLFSYILSKPLNFFPDKSLTFCENHESQCKIPVALPLSFVSSLVTDWYIASISLELCWGVCLLPEHRWQQRTKLKPLLLALPFAQTCFHQIATHLKGCWMDKPSSLLKELYGLVTLHG